MVLCQNCGFNNPQGQSFCASCGQPLARSQAPYGNQTPSPYGGQPPYWNQPSYGGQPPYGGPGYIILNPTKSHTVAMLLCFFFGTLGIHRFYMGKIITGILMLLTAGFFGIWTIFDMFTFIFSNFYDGNGQPLANKNIVLVIIFGIIYIIPIIIVTLFILGLAKLMVSAIL